MRDIIKHDGIRVYVTRRARNVLAKLNPSRRKALSDGFARVGSQLLSSAEQVEVDPGWARGTSPRRHYPQQCYPKTTKFVLDHPGIEGMRLVHGVVSHPPHFVPLDHAWVELPGDVVFDGVVQAFFSHGSYYAAMAPMALDAYSAVETQRMVDEHAQPGPWNANWVPTDNQLETYAATVRTAQDVAAAAAPSASVGKNR